MRNSRCCRNDTAMRPLTLRENETGHGDPWSARHATATGITVRPWPQAGSKGGYCLQVTSPVPNCEPHLGALSVPSTLVWYGTGRTQTDCRDDRDNPEH